MSAEDNRPDEDAAFDETASEADPESVDEAPADEPAATEDEPTTEKKKSSGLLSLLAILLSIVALAGLGFVLWQDYREAASTQNNTDSLSRLNARLESSRETIVALQDRLSEQADTNSDLRQRVSGLEASLSDPSQLLGSLPARTSSLERGLSALQGVSAGTRDNWLLAEAEYYLQIANSQLQLANNPALAAAALRQADERLADLSSPAFTQVRAAVSNELTELDLVNEVDVTGMTMTLASLSRVVSALPVRSNERATDEASSEIDPELTGIDRAWDSVKKAMSGAVKVTRPDEAGSPLLSPDAAILLRANLSLQLQAARLALLKGERAVFEQSLEDAENWLMSYFDIRSVQVASALETITEIRNSPAMGDLPDISASLELLRQQRMLDESQP